MNQALGTVALGVALARELKVIGSSDKVHVVDALAITGEEGRGSLRKAAGSWQTSFDPQISEWGNPPLHRWLSSKEELCARVLCAHKSRVPSPTRCRARAAWKRRVMYGGVAQAESIGLERRTC